LWHLLIIAVHADHRDSDAARAVRTAHQAFDTQGLESAYFRQLEEHVLRMTLPRDGGPALDMTGFPSVPPRHRPRLDLRSSPSPHGGLTSERDHQIITVGLLAARFLPGTRRSLTVKRKTFAAATAIAVAGLAAITAPSAGAVTPSCGPNCVALYNLIYGTADVIGVNNATGTSAEPGQFTFLMPASGGNQAEDWVLSAQDTVNDFYLAGLMSADLNTHYGNDEAYEYEYAPDGVLSGYCLGVPGQASDGTVVSLQPCGQTAQTVWIFDTADQYKRQIPLINGLDTNFSYPEVLTADSTTDQLHVSMLTGGDGVIDNGQYWATEFGVLP
jgi:hypothetical protein